MKNYILVIISFLGLLACKNHEAKTPVVEKQEKKDFFPVGDYIMGEIAYVDSLPLRLMEYNIHNGKTDSAFINLDEFNRFAHEFLPAELKDSLVFEKEFSENSFLDQTTQTLTFTYSTKNEKLDLQRVDILANRTSGYDKVRSIYMEKTGKQNDTAVLKKMYWRAKKSFEIVTILQPLNQPQITNRLKVVWDNSE